MKPETLEWLTRATEDLEAVGYLKMWLENQPEKESTKLLSARASTGTKTMQFSYNNPA